METRSDIRHRVRTNVRTTFVSSRITRVLRSFVVSGRALVYQSASQSAVNLFVVSGRWSVPLQAIHHRSNWHQHWPNLTDTFNTVSHRRTVQWASNLTVIKRNKDILGRTDEYKLGEGSAYWPAPSAQRRQLRLPLRASESESLPGSRFVKRHFAVLDVIVDWEDGGVRPVSGPAGRAVDGKIGNDESS